jgi:diguanylate cyclase (GGDEF)-like protein/PAS domain S-box-containing protein
MRYYQTSAEQIRQDNLEKGFTIMDAELRYQALFERSSDSIFLVDLDLVIIAANDKCTEFLGYRRDELVGMLISNLIETDEFGDTQQKYQAMLRGDVLGTYHRTFIRKDGRKVVGEISVSVVQDRNGSPEYIQSIVRDFTHWIEDKKALADGEARYRALFEQVNDGVTLFDLDGLIIDANLRAAEILGVGVEEMIGRQVQEFSAEEEVHRTEHIHEKVLAGEKVPIYERLLRRKDGTAVPVEINITLVRDREGNPQYVQSITRDISARKQVEETLHYLSRHDSLTGLPNRLHIYDRIDKAIQLGQRYQRKFAVLFMDMDKFKQVNDTFGHSFGDQLLVIFTERLRTCIRESDTVGRIGGDEFVLVLEEVGDTASALESARRVTAILEQPYLLEGNQIKLSVSIGISIYPDHGSDSTTLIDCADKALYTIKSNAQERYSIYG